MTTGNNKENPYGDYVPGQYSSGASAQGQQDAAPSSSSYGQGAAGQAPQTTPTPVRILRAITARSRGMGTTASRRTALPHSLTTARRITASSLPATPPTGMTRIASR